MHLLLIYLPGFYLENCPGESGGRRQLEESGFYGGMMVKDVTKFHKHHLGGRGMLECVCAGIYTTFRVLERGENFQVSGERGGGGENSQVSGEGGELPSFWRGGGRTPKFLERGGGGRTPKFLEGRGENSKVSGEGGGELQSFWSVGENSKVSGEGGGELQSFWRGGGRTPMFLECGGELQSFWSVGENSSFWRGGRTPMFGIDVEEVVIPHNN